MKEDRYSNWFGPEAGRLFLVGPIIGIYGIYSLFKFGQGDKKHIQVVAGFVGSYVLAMQFMKQKKKEQNKKACLEQKEFDKKNIRVKRPVRENPNYPGGGNWEYAKKSEYNKIVKCKQNFDNYLKVENMKKYMKPDDWGSEEHFMRYCKVEPKSKEEALTHTVYNNIEDPIDKLPKMC